MMRRAPIESVSTRWHRTCGIVIGMPGARLVFLGKRTICSACGESLTGEAVSAPRGLLHVACADAALQERRP